MMDASTREMLYKLDEMISVISEYITLEPGDMISPAHLRAPPGCMAIAGSSLVTELTPKSRGLGSSPCVCATIDCAVANADR